MKALVLTAPDMCALELAEADNLFRAGVGWRGKMTATVRNATVKRLESLGLITREYRVAAAVEAAIATEDGKRILEIARRQPRRRIITQPTEEFA